ncbi:hypothetical protein B0A79_19650 [Flavobacterium piscis]|uniref:Cell wall anchor protein n=1 Tax=Flavobacterium piscis TaxID=1114874 RepID=A0ABX2XHQ9_9FLAO|nr:hypothetical protein [Flavobacterium piscis]OCB73412.1 hypothetical protein FLP_11960 [Flavobacterium piscis]OXE98951.1 hypothetical protein B0A79_19650 [Flavobacterium piscis]
MSTKSTLQSLKTFLLLFFFLITLIGNAQIGIGTTTPDATSILDINSTEKGILAPRMTTAQRTAITTPAQGLLVYDTDLKLFYYFSSPSGWLPLLNSSVGRTNFKRVKSAADLAPELALGGSVYQLSSNTLYEINGSITLAAPINLNDAYVTGIDTNEDILTFPGGIIFSGNTGGSIRNVTLKAAARAFNITGGTSLFIQNIIIDGMTTNVGTISGVGLYFGNIVQFINNTNGITYSGISSLLLSNQAWLNTNNGTFETLTGTFGLIQKNSGFSTVDGADLALDVNGITTLGTGILLGTVFSGTTTNTAGYVRGYPAASTYTGYNFSNAWTVDAPGIPREADSEATGDINFDVTVGSGAPTGFSGTGTTSRKKVLGATLSNSLFRFTKDGDNKITYRGNKPRYFQIVGSISYQNTADATFILYIAKNNLVLPETKVYGRPSGGILVTSGITALPIVGTVQMKTGDYIEIWAERYDGSGNMSTISLNLTAR